MSATVTTPSSSLIKPILVALRRTEATIPIPKAPPEIAANSAEVLDRSMEEPERWDGMA
jgi:hypothetical protein